MNETDRKKSGKETAIDTAKDVLAWIVVTGIAFVYWVAMLLLVSLFLVNVWHVTFEEIVGIAVILAAVTSVVYLGKLIYRRLH